MMPFLADTNVLLRLLQRGDPDHAAVRAALRTLTARGERIYFVSQNLVEFWRVCTRPAPVNGLGMSVSETNHWAEIVERLFLLAPDRPEVHTEWRHIVVANSVSGVQVHDARLVAAMRVHGLTHLLTFNVRDFSRYSGVIIVHPLDI
jgi:predicted nucleic acid-binding protein